MTARTKQDIYAFTQLLHEINDTGFLVVSKYKVWRLLDKGSGAAGTWSAFLDEWEEISGKRSDLYGFEKDGRYYLFTKEPSALTKWAGE